MVEDRLYFPRIGDEWGTTEYPYPSATSKQMINMLLEGGNLSTFIYDTRAISIVISKIAKEKSFENVLVLTSDDLKATNFMRHLSISLSHTIPEWKSIATEFSKTGVHLENGLNCDISSIYDNSSCFIGTNTAVFIFCNRGIDRFILDNIAPVIKYFDAQTRVYVIDILFNDELANMRRAKSPTKLYEDWWYATLKMYTLSDYLTIIERKINGLVIL